MTLWGARTSTLFCLLAGALFLAGVAGSGMMIVVHAAFGISNSLSAQMEAVVTSVVPALAAGLWSCGASYLAQRGWTGTAAVMLAAAWVCIDATLLWLRGAI